MIIDRGGVLVVAAHADDEVLGAGGTIAAARAKSMPVHVLVLSTSVTSRRLCADTAERIRRARADDAAAAAVHLGASVEIHDLPDNGFATVPGPEVAWPIERAVRDLEPAVVLTHWSHDLSEDHRVTARAAMVACRPQRGASTPALYSYEVRSSTDWLPGATDGAFAPTVFVELDEPAWAAKCAALACYGDELRDAPHARSMEGLDALARYRGTQVGVARAEAFLLLRAVVTA